MPYWRATLLSLGKILVVWVLASFWRRHFFAPVLDSIHLVDILRNFGLRTRFNYIFIVN